VTELALPDETVGVRWTRTGVEVLDPLLPIEVYIRCVEFAGVSGDAAKWALGDLLLVGSNRWPEKYSQALEASRLSERQVSRYRYVAERVRPSRRREKLTFSHHEEVAPLEPADQDRLLARAERERFSVAVLREAVLDVRAVERSVRQTPPRQEVLPATGVADAVGGLLAVRETLTTVAKAIDSAEGRDAVGIPAALRALDTVGRTVRDAVKVLARPSLTDAWGLVEAASVRQHRRTSARGRCSTSSRRSSRRTTTRGEARWRSRWYRT
jgi:hypothetical protein